MQLEHVIKTVDQLASDWERYNTTDSQKTAKLNKCENELQKLKGEFQKMRTDLVKPDFLIQPDFTASNSSAANQRSGNFRDDSFKDPGFCNFIKSRSGPEEYKSLSTDQKDYGSFTVEAEKYLSIVSQLTSKTPMRQLASVDSISSNVLELVMQEGDFDSGWVAETDQRNVTDNPKLIQKRIPVHELYAQPKATQRLLDDAQVNVEQWLTDRLIDSFARAENRCFINGDGNNKPRGILTYDTVKRVDAINIGSIDQGIIAQDFLNLISSLDEMYLANATFLMNRRTLALVQKLQDNTGRFIWTASIAEKMPATIFGIPVVCTNDMPDLVKDKLVVALADFKAAYKIVDRQGIHVMKDPYTDKPFVKFYATKRVGADVINQEAIRLLKF